MKNPISRQLISAIAVACAIAPTASFSAQDDVPPPPPPPPTETKTTETTVTTKVAPITESTEPQTITEIRPAVHLSKPAEEVLKLSRAKVSEGAIVAFIMNAGS